MRLVNRNIFLTLPEGTLYCKFKPNYWYDHLQVKGPSLTNDWYYTELIGDMGDSLSEVEATKDLQSGHSVSFLMREYASRDGYYDEDELFCIYENHDIDDLIEQLLLTKPTSVSNTAYLAKVDPISHED